MIPIVLGLAASAVSAIAGSTAATVVAGTVVSAAVISSIGENSDKKSETNTRPVDVSEVPEDIRKKFDKR